MKYFGGGFLNYMDSREILISVYLKYVDLMFNDVKNYPSFQVRLHNSKFFSEIFYLITLLIMLFAERYI